MSPTEKQLATTIANYLTTRGDRIASDLGLLTFRDVDGVLVADVAGGTYEISIVVTKAANDNTKGRK